MHTIPESDPSGVLVRRLPLFVYGTLKPGGANYAAYLANRTVQEGPATLQPAALFTDGQYPYLVLDPTLIDPLDQVHGMLVVLHPEHYDETLRRIDWLEDYKPASPWSLYERVSQHVATAEGQIEAWTYVAGPRIVAGIQAGRLRQVDGGVWPATGT